MCSCVVEISLVSAILLAQVVNYVFNPSNRATIPTWSWHVQFVLGGIFGAGLVVMGLVVPESRVWLTYRMQKRQRERAKLEQKRTLWSRRMSRGADQTQVSTPSIKTSTHQPIVRKGWSGLLHLTNIRWLSLALLLAAANQLTGINAIIFYAPRIFEDAGFASMALVLTIAVVRPSTTRETSNR
jgi:hypothetical protein